MHKYTEWETDMFECVKKDLLMTLSYICDNKSRDNGKSYSSYQLDDVKDIVKTLCMMNGSYTYHTKNTDEAHPKMGIAR